MSDELEYDEPYRGTQILWGRVVVLLLALALAFWLGTTFGGDASAQADLEAQRAEITRLESQVEALEAEVAAVDAGTSDASPDPEPDDEGGQDEDGGQEDDGDRDRNNERERSEESAEDTSEYVVQSGDSLASIAQDVYGDPTLWSEIARANDLSEPYSLTVGDRLDIPAQP